jgi:hypothetical protein
MRFAGVDLLVQATPMTVVGSHPTSVSSRLVDAYEQAEATIVAIASSVASTIGRLSTQTKKPTQVEVEFGLSVSVEGNIVVATGTAEATLAITLTYDASA